MPATIAQPAPAGVRNPAARGQDETLVLPNPFARASEEQFFSFDDRSVQMVATGPLQQGPIDVPATGFLRHVVLLVTTSGGAGGAAVVAKHEDSPWRALQDITLTDTNGTTIVGPLDGYELMLANRWGVYAFESDPVRHPAYSDVAVGSGATGHFAFLLRVPVEIAGRDGLGALPNMNASNTYKLTYSVAASTRVYTVVPATTLPLVRVRAGLEAWAPPPPADQRGVPNITVPPAMGTTQNWTRTQVNVNAGDQRVRLPRVGNLLRTLVFILRTTGAGTPRTTVDFPDPVRVELDRNVLTNEWRDYRRGLMRERYTQALDAFDTGVLVVDFTHDLDYKPGNEMRDQYLPTTQATALEVLGSFGAAATLTVLTNDVGPQGDIYTENR
ncbi:MAG: hypothetical protein LC798_05320 [Chloroflexi bacterium]|nr:hypothetical protein [Chloroflexota bacterium]